MFLIRNEISFAKFGSDVIKFLEGNELSLDRKTAGQHSSRDSTSPPEMKRRFKTPIAGMYCNKISILAVYKFHNNCGKWRERSMQVIYTAKLHLARFRQEFQVYIKNSTNFKVCFRCCIYVSVR